MLAYEIRCPLISSLTWYISWIQEQGLNHVRNTVWPKQDEDEWNIMKFPEKGMHYKFTIEIDEAILNVPFLLSPTKCTRKEKARHFFRVDSSFIIFCMIPQVFPFLLNASNWFSEKQQMLICGRFFSCHIQHEETEI